VREWEIDRSEWRLLPSERVLWYGRPVPGIARDGRWRIGPALGFAFAVIFALFAGLLHVAQIPGAQQVATTAALAALFGVSVTIAPRYLLDPCEYLVTDRRVLWRRGRFKRSIDRAGITYARIRWHRGAPGIGHLELVRAVPFGPLARRQRLVFHDVRAPDAVFALIRGAEEPEHAGDNDVSLIERLDPGEEVVWGGHPEGWLIGWREVATSLVGAGAVALAIHYGYVALGVLLGLEDVGLAVRSWTWVLLFLAVVTTWCVIMAIGVGLAWHGLWRSRALGRETEYLLTDARLLIRRGRTELSVDRRRIVDLADTRAARGLHHVFLVLDAPESRALADSGALGKLTPARDAVPPVLYELRDVQALRDLILGGGGRPSRPTLPPVRDAA